MTIVRGGGVSRRSRIGPSLRSGADQLGPSESLNYLVGHNDDNDND